MRAVDGGFVSTTRGMVCDPTVLLCISCAGMHWELATGKRLGL